MYKYMCKHALALSALMFFAVAPAQAETLTYKLDKPHTQVVFAVNHLGFSNSIGKFLDYDGTITYDKAAVENSSVAVTIKTASVDLADQKWNDHMKNKDFFNVEQFPEMTFKSTKIERTGENTANITGDLTLLGVTKPVVLAAVLNQEGKHPMSGKAGIGVSATAKIKRSEFGMNYGLPMVGDDVDIRIEVEAYEETLDANDTTNN